jgi:hypothetical protein
MGLKEAANQLTGLFRQGDTKDAAASVETRIAKGFAGFLILVIHTPTHASLGAEPRSLPIAAKTTAREPTQ